MILTPKLRKELKNPLGTLIKGTPKETMKKLSEIIRTEKPASVVSVGDVVSRSMIEEGIRTNMAIVDNKVMREKVEPVKLKVKVKVGVKNPSGIITPESWAAVEQAFTRREPTYIVVEGEEDLLTLVAVLKAPENSLVVYGQPHEGIVVVKTDRTAKKRVLRIIEAMEPLPKS